MKKLSYQLRDMSYKHADGSFATQAARRFSLALFAKQLEEEGYRQLEAKSLKPKHIDGLVKRWQNEGVSNGTIKNRMTHLRWWAGKVNKASVVARDNSHYGIGSRRYVTNIDKSVNVNNEDLVQIKDNNLKLSLELQREFGLRREEAMKFQVNYADKGDFIKLKPSWTKGGKERVIPVRTDSQRDLLTRVKSLSGLGSLIPNGRRYIDQLRIYERQTAAAGLSKLHGLRHLYAQKRYFEITGNFSPSAGGPTTKNLKGEEKIKDYEARLIISSELGHEREQITAVYLGR